MKGDYCADKPVNEGIIKTELEYELLQLRLNLATSIFIVILRGQNTQRVNRSCIHFGV